VNICKISSKLSNPFDSIGKDPLGSCKSAFIYHSVYISAWKKSRNLFNEKRQGQIIETREKAWV
jgi:hypothetical protein